MEALLACLCMSWHPRTKLYCFGEKGHLSCRLVDLVDFCVAVTDAKSNLSLGNTLETNIVALKNIDENGYVWICVAKH